MLTVQSGNDLCHQLKAKVKAKDVCLKICFTFIIIFLDGSTQLLPLFIYIF